MNKTKFDILYQNYILEYRETEQSLFLFYMHV